MVDSSREKLIVGKFKKVSFTANVRMCNLKQKNILNGFDV